LEDKKKTHNNTSELNNNSFISSEKQAIESVSKRKNTKNKTKKQYNTIQ